MPPESDTYNRKIASRLDSFLAHLTRYMFDGKKRLMEDTGLSRTEVHRLLSGDCNPSYRVLLAVLDALERQLGERIDPREILSYSGTFERTVCEIVHCRGCSSPGLSSSTLGGEAVLPLPAQPTGSTNQAPYND